MPAEPNYFILDTDYDSYSLVYGCEDIQYFWILSRTPTMEQDMINKLNAYAMEKLPNYDWSLATIDVQGDSCNYVETEMKPFERKTE